MAPLGMQMSRKRKKTKQSNRIKIRSDAAVTGQRRAELARKKNIRRQQQHEYYTKQKRNKKYRDYS